MIDILEQPGLFNFSKNPAVFQTQGTSYYTTAPVTEHINITVNGIGVMENADTITLVWTDSETSQVFSVTLTAVETPNNDGSEIQDDSIAYSLSSMAALYVQYLKYNALILIYFEVDYFIDTDGTPKIVIVLTPRKAIESFSVTEANFAEVLIAATEGVKREFYTINCEVSNTEIGNVTLAQTPNSQGIATFEISNIIDKAIIPTFDFLSNIAIIKPYLFAIRFAEEWDDILQSWTTPTRHFFARNTERTDFDQTINGLLSHIERPKRVSINAKEFLHRINSTSSVVSMNIEFRCYFTDGTTTAWINPGIGATNVNINEIYQVDVSPFALDVENVSMTKTVAMYEVRFVGMTETFKYKLDFDYNQAYKNIAFLNDLGVLECLETKGIWEYNVSINREFANTIHDYNRIKQNQFSTDSEKAIKIRTGFLYQYEVAAIQRMMKSDFIFYENENAEWVQILLNTKSIKFTDEKQINSFDIEAVEAIN